MMISVLIRPTSVLAALEWDQADRLAPILPHSRARVPSENYQRWRKCAHQQMRN
jgi:hypothetical protein